MIALCGITIGIILGVILVIRKPMTDKELANKLNRMALDRNNK